MTFSTFSYVILGAVLCGFAISFYRMVARRLRDKDEVLPPVTGGGGGGKKEPGDNKPAI